MQQLSDERAPIDFQPQDRLVEILMWLVFKGALPVSWNRSCHGQPGGHFARVIMTPAFFEGIGFGFLAAKWTLGGT